MMKTKQKTLENKEKVFLETNVQFLLLHGTKRQQKIIKETIKETYIYSSHYVLREYHLIYTSVLIEFYYLLDGQFDTVSEALKEFQYSNSFKTSRFKSLFLTIASEVQPFTNLEKAKAMLELYIREAEKRFTDMVFQMLNLTDCPILFVGRTKEEFYSFLKELSDEEKFSLERFFRFRTGKLSMLINADNSLMSGLKKEHKEEFNDLKVIYKNIVSNLSAANIKKNKKKLGDTIIALESPSTACLITFDKIFHVLCPALQKRYTVIQQPRQIRLPKSSFSN